MNSPSQLNRDLRAGRINRIQHLQYEFLSHFAPQRLPERYRGISSSTRGPRSLTPLLFQIRANLGKLDDSTQALYKKISQIPSNTKKYTSPRGHFLILYYDTGSSAVPTADDDNDGVPDYVEMTAALFDSAWKVEVEQLNYPPPRVYSPPGTAAADLDKYKVILENLGPYYYGFTNPLEPGSYIQIRNNYDDFQVTDWRGSLINDYRTNPAGGVGVTAAHEMFHAIQMSYYDNIGDPEYFSWTEGSAVLMEETAFPSVNDYFQYVDGFFSYPDSSLSYEGNSDDLHGYASCVWPMFLARRYGHGVIRREWELTSSYPGRPYSALDAALREWGSDFGEAFAAFAEACFFTGSRARTEDFPDADKYPLVAEARTLTVQNAVEELADSVNLLAFKYYRLQPDRVPQRRIEFAGSAGTNWQAVAIALDSAGRSDVFPFVLNGQGKGRIQIDGWNSYQTVMLAAINAGQTSKQAFRFILAAAEYDTVRLQAGEFVNTVLLDGDLSVTLKASAPISSVLAASYTTASPAGSQRPAFGTFYDLRFSSDVGSSLTSADFEIRYNAAQVAELNKKGLRIQELGCFLFDSTSSTWNYQTPVVVDSQNAVVRFTLARIGFIGLLRRPDIVEKFVAYPSPADFRKTLRVFFPMQDGRTLSLFSIDGTLVRRLTSGNPNEFDVNRFVWDGKNQQGADVRPGIYYAVGANASATNKAKVLVLR